MSISVWCICGNTFTVDDALAGTRRRCASCGRMVDVPDRAGAAPSAGESAVDFVAPLPKRVEQSGKDSPLAGTFVETRDRSHGHHSQEDRPHAHAKAANEVPVARRMLEALLDPRAIQWMLMIGGGLAVVGLIVWLVSLGIFKDPRIMAVALGLGSLAVLGSGWWVSLKTRYRVAGQALTFLGCVIAPLNLWFYHAQGLITLDHHLWIGGLVCVLFYAGTVFVLRDPLFMYAVEAGATLTVLLLMAELHRIRDVASFSMFLLGLGFISIHAERAFPPEGTFARRRFGLPLFWCGHAQSGVALLALLGSQIVGWLTGPLGLAWTGNVLTQNDLLAGGLWIAAAYLYLYSDLVVRRVGVYMYLAALCVLLAEVTLVLPHVNQEGLIAVLAVTSLVLMVVEQFAIGGNEKVPAARADDRRSDGIRSRLSGRRAAPAGDQRSGSVRGVPIRHRLEFRRRDGDGCRHEPHRGLSQPPCRPQGGVGLLVLQCRGADRGGGRATPPAQLDRVVSASSCPDARAAGLPLGRAALARSGNPPAAVVGGAHGHGGDPVRVLRGRHRAQLDRDFPAADRPRREPVFGADLQRGRGVLPVRGLAQSPAAERLRGNACRLRRALAVPGLFRDGERDLPVDLRRPGRGDVDRRGCREFAWRRPPANRRSRSDGWKVMD